MTDQDIHMIDGLSHPLNYLWLYGDADRRLYKWHKVRFVNQQWVSTNHALTMHYIIRNVRPFTSNDIG